MLTNGERIGEKITGKCGVNGQNSKIRYLYGERFSF